MRKIVETEELKHLHRTSFGTAPAAKLAPVCSCFYCLSSFPGQSIDHVTVERDGRETALCPNCGIDSVLPNELSKSLLRQMRTVYFSPIVVED